MRLHNGLLVDPTDPRSFGHAIAELLANPARASALGDAGHGVVERDFLHTRQLAEWDELLAALVETTNTREPARGAKLQLVRDPAPSRPRAGNPGRGEGQNEFA